MTLTSQFSLEEENFYKDIQDLVKNRSQNEKELSLFLQRYMDLLTRADLDEETFIINFTKAGLIIEASTKVYGTKVDKLWINLEHVLESLKSKNSSQAKKKLDSDDGDELDVEGGGDDDEGKKKLPHSRRRKKMDALFSVDDFLEIDNVSGLLGKNMNEGSNNKESKIKLCEKVPNMFIKNKKKRSRIDVCLNKNADDKDVIRLRDWVISSECLLIKEIYTPRPENLPDSLNLSYENKTKNDLYEKELINCDSEPMRENLSESEVLKEEKNNNSIEATVKLKQSLREGTPGKQMSFLEEKDENCDNELNVSKESDVAKFPNLLNKLSEDCLVDVDDMFWNTSKFQDVIPSKKMKVGKTNRLPCLLCANKKVHKKKGKRCMEDKKCESLDSYFTPHVQPSVAEPQFGILPDEDLYSVFKIEMKLIEQLRKVSACKNINEVYHPGERPDELGDFLGFDGFENCLMKRTIELQDDEMSEENLRLDHMEDDNENYMDDPPPNNEFELPFPVTENTIGTSIIIKGKDQNSKDEQLANSESEYQKLVMEELKDHYAAKTSFAKNKELGIKISQWHEMIADKIKLSQKRGALNMKSLAEKIMSAFSSSIGVSKPQMAFKELVMRQSRRDIPRYFFACLQLTNEGNLDISRSNPQPLVTDCMIITQLRRTRENFELDENTVTSLCREINSSDTLTEKSKKRNSLSSSPSYLNIKILKNNKKIKQEIVKSQKRSKNFNLIQNSKRRCSIGSPLFSD